MTKFCRYTPLALAALCSSVSTLSLAQTAPNAAADFHQKVQRVLEDNCYDCHGDGKSKGGVAFDKLGSDADIVGNVALWAKALKNVRAGLMPPAGNQKPTAAEIDTLSNWIKYEAFGLDPKNPDPGRVTVRRLNRDSRHSVETDGHAPVPSDLAWFAIIIRTTKELPLCLECSITQEIA